MHKSHGLGISLFVGSALLLTACDSGPGADAYGGGVRGAMVAKCVPRLSRQAASPAIAEAVCGCMADQMLAEGLSMTDMFAGGRDRMVAITRQCAQANGLPIPS